MQARIAGFEQKRERKRSRLGREGSTVWPVASQMEPALDTHIGVGALAGGLRRGLSDGLAVAGGGCKGRAGEQLGWKGGRGSSWVAAREGWRAIQAPGATVLQSGLSHSLCCPQLVSGCRLPTGAQNHVAQGAAGLPPAIAVAAVTASAFPDAMAEAMACAAALVSPLATASAMAVAWAEAPWLRWRRCGSAAGGGGARARSQVGAAGERRS